MSVSQPDTCGTASFLPRERFCNGRTVCIPVHNDRIIVRIGCHAPDQTEPVEPVHDRLHLFCRNRELRCELLNKKELVSAASGNILDNADCILIGKCFQHPADPVGILQIRRHALRRLLYIETVALIGIQACKCDLIIGMEQCIGLAFKFAAPLLRRSTGSRQIGTENGIPKPFDKLRARLRRQAVQCAADSLYRIRTVCGGRQTEQRIQRDIQCSSKLRELLCIRIAAGFPFGDCLRGDIHPFGELFLREPERSSALPEIRMEILFLQHNKIPMPKQCTDAEGAYI